MAEAGDTSSPEVADWPQDLPEHHFGQQLEETVQQGVEACDIPAEVLASDCSEPPCVAVLLDDSEGTAAWSLGANCAPLREQYGDGNQTWGHNIDCGDYTERLILYSPRWGDASPDAREERIASVLDEWACGG